MGVGAGVVIYKGGRVIAERALKLSSTATVFQAEIKAMALASEMLLDIQETESYKFVKLLSDSQAAVRAVNKREVTSLTVWQTITNLNKEGRSCTAFTIAWIKAHVGFEGNERADCLAKTGTTLSLEEEGHIPVANTIHKSMISDAALSVWSKEWIGYAGARQTKQFFPDIDTKVSKELLKLNRWKLSTVVGVITGHGNLRYHSHLKDPSLPRLCRFCSETDETFYHFFTQCPSFLQTRHLRCMSSQPGEKLRWKLEDILFFIRLESISQLLGGPQEQPTFHDNTSIETNGSGIDVENDYELIQSPP